MSKKIPTYTLEELADAHIIPAKLTPKERAEVDAEMHVFRMRILAEMTEEDKKKSAIMRLSCLIRRYLQQNGYLSNYSFEACIQEYLNIWGKKIEVLAQEIQLTPSQLKDYLSGKEPLTLALMYRLEKHSGKLIPALFWWRVASRDMEQVIQKDAENRQKEWAKVKSALTIDQ